MTGMNDVDIRFILYFNKGYSPIAIFNHYKLFLIGNIANKIVLFYSNTNTKKYSVKPTIKRSFFARSY